MTDFIKLKTITSTATTVWTKSNSFITDENLPNENQSYLYNELSSVTLCSHQEKKSVILHYLHRLVKMYLSSPYFLVIFPFLFGIIFGLLLNYFLVQNNHLWRNKIIKMYYDYFQNPTERDAQARNKLKDEDSIAFKCRESGVPLKDTPLHIAVIMDGNRRYGREKYGVAIKGHWDGSRKLVEFCKWCLAERIQILTVYAFSTENWSRHPDEISSLMEIFTKYCDELRLEAIQGGIRIRVLTTNDEKLPENVKAGLKRMEQETSHLDKLVLNVCISYGSRSELVLACRNLAKEVLSKTPKTITDDLIANHITEQSLSNHLLSSPYPDPDLIIRTSGEMRFSNFLLWQCAYTEIFFLNKHWPSLEKIDLLKVIRAYVHGRQRRYGK